MEDSNIKSTGSRADVDRWIVKDHNTLFESPNYQKQFADKRLFEQGATEEEIARVEAWTRTWEYREINFSRSNVLINPAKACQPLGGILAAAGFANTLPLVHGSQGCVAYFRSHFSRHFKEPFAAVSSSMTEDGAVFGGLKNLREALLNAVQLYKPAMVAICTTCMAEVIGDDVSSFVADFREEGVVDTNLPVAFANTPSFVGSHITGYDNMMRAILSDQAQGVSEKDSIKINIIPGFETYVGNIREVKHILRALGVEATILGDTSDALDSPATGEYIMYPGGTPLNQLRAAAKNRATIALSRYSTKKTMDMIRKRWKQDAVALIPPIGITATDAFIKEIQNVTGCDVPEELLRERGRAVDAMLDSHSYLHGKRVALVGDPDVLLGIVSFLLEMGAEPEHIVCTNGDNDFLKEMTELLSTSPHGVNAKVWIGKDMWHLRSLVLTEPVDFLIGNTYAKQVAKEADIPHVRVGFPIFDRHHLHRFPIIGYNGTVFLLQQMVNAILDDLDRKSPAYSFDAIR